jgi:hypothetical protein
VISCLPHARPPRGHTLVHNAAMRDLRLLFLACALPLVACPSGDPNPFGDDDDLVGVDDDDSGTDDDDATADDDDATADDDDATADDDDATADDDDATTDDDDATADDDDATTDDDDATADDDDATTDDDDATADDDDATSGPGGPVVFLTGAACGYTATAGNTGFDNNAWGYPACGLADSGWDAGEWVVTLGQPGTVTLTLTWADTTKDLDLIVLDGGNVTTSSCWGSSTSSSGGSETVTFLLPAGQVAWIVIDGKGGDETAFTLVVSCA